MSKPLGNKNYGSIPHLSNSKLGDGDHYIHSGQENIMTKNVRDRNDLVIVTQKYDGSNVGIAKKDGKIYALTRSGYEASTSPYKQHHWFSDWVSLNKHYFKQILADGERIVGELLVKTHSEPYLIEYLTPIVFFDWFDSCNKRKPFRYLKNTNLPIPQILHEGYNIEVETALVLQKKFIDKRFYTQCPEGLIYRVERNNEFDFMAKWVRKDFKPGIYLDNDYAWNYDID